MENFLRESVNVSPIPTSSSSLVMPGFLVPRLKINEKGFRERISFLKFYRQGGLVSDSSLRNLKDDSQG